MKLTYPRESVVAEKFEATVGLSLANRRTKDFYDIWIMAGTFRLKALHSPRRSRRTFERREHPPPPPGPVCQRPDLPYDAPTGKVANEPLYPRSEIIAD